jgi:hypothetical protein
LPPYGSKEWCYNSFAGLKFGLDRWL